jgi:soluble lytic murein transglycosylase
MFFFEKKNQKTFGRWRTPAGDRKRQRIKVFCFFSSEKRTFLFLLWLILVLSPACHAQIIDALHAHDWPRAQALAAADPDPIAQKLVTFARLLTPDAATAAEIGAFMAANPVWPDQANLRHALAVAIAHNPDQAAVLADCAAYRPGLDSALLRCADAERQAGHGDAARNLAQRAWIDGVRDAGAEADFLKGWSGVLTPEVEWRRFEVLDWANDPAAARQAGRLDPAHQALAAARLAFQHRDKRALDFLPAIPEALRADPALLLEQARWLRITDADAAALALWRGAVAPAESKAPADHRASFWTERDRLARAIVAQDVAGAAYLADDPDAVPDQKPESLFLSGWIALERQHDAAGALKKFDALAALSHSLITQARAWYWTGRAESGDAAKDAYRRAAAFPTTYYGQLAIEALGGRDAVDTAIQQAADPAITPEQEKAYSSTDMVHAATTLVRWKDASWGRQFLLTQAQHAPDAAGFAFAARTALSLGMPDIAVQTARFAGREGVALPHVGYPAPFAPPPGTDAPLILGLMRQESSFDAGIVSGAGAVGLMQLMPATARQIAGRGQPAPDLKNPDENMRLGIAYFQALLAQFGGVRPYAIAAYNAGPHRAHAWVTDTGDAAASGQAADMIDWIEEIPYGETRNYVQRVLENSRIYAAHAAR